MRFVGRLGLQRRGPGEASSFQKPSNVLARGIAVGFAITACVFESSGEWNVTAYPATPHPQDLTATVKDHTPSERGGSGKRRFGTRIWVRGHRAHLGVWPALVRSGSRWRDDAVVALGACSFAAPDASRFVSRQPLRSSRCRILHTAQRGLERVGDHGASHRGCASKGSCSPPVPRARSAG